MKVMRIAGEGYPPMMPCCSVIVSVRAGVGKELAEVAGADRHVHKYE